MPLYIHYQKDTLSGKVGDCIWASCRVANAARPRIQSVSTWNQRMDTLTSNPHEHMQPCMQYYLVCGCCPEHVRERKVRPRASFLITHAEAIAKWYRTQYIEQMRQCA